MNPTSAISTSFPITPPHYSRIIPRTVFNYTKEDLVELANRMMGDPNKASNLPVLSGLVYFGQFIDHDLTRDRTRLEEDPYPEPTETRNWRTPKLDLDSVYGNGPNNPQTLPEGDYIAYDDMGRFRVDVVEGIEDLPRDAAANPMIPESRNDENLIISQLHLIFMQFHNRVLDLIGKAPGVFRTLPGPSLFASARQIVIWHYHWLIRHYFLPGVLHPMVHEELRNPDYQPRLFDPPANDPVALPIEFTMAAFRFGHSMIRDGYVLNSETTLEVSEILNREARRLTAKNVIDWDRFFDAGRQELVNAAQRIDPTIVRALYSLSDRIILLYKEKGPASEHSLAARTLLRGWKAGLASGQQLCEKARVPFIALSEKDADCKFVKERLLGQIPLWYYILHEAEVAGTTSAGECGHYLGPLGSRIVGEVFHAIFRSDNESYSKGWVPPPFQLTTDGPFYQIDSLRELIAFAKNRSMTETSIEGRVR
jgi:hypothetical protein